MLVEDIKCINPRVDIIYLMDRISIYLMKGVYIKYVCFINIIANIIYCVG